MRTQKKRADRTPYAKFGRLLTQRRLEAGIAQQGDLAKRLKIAQQSVSRWERGESRPRTTQIAAIAKAVGAKPAELMTAAGYSSKLAVASFVQPFPIDSLTAEDFERFAHYFLSKRFPTGKVHRAGGQGHTQDGIDLDVTFPDGSVFTFQCKRIEEFGPQKVHAVVAKHKRKAKRKFILLARVASPQARRAIGEHRDWDVWDREDISREVRDLVVDEQRRLVDIFFRGQRLALLGTDASGPWQTGEEFFAGYLNRRGALNHTWELVGRSDELKRLQEGLGNPDVTVVNLEGPGGAGKTRVLKAAIESFETANTGVMVRFLSQVSEATLESLIELGAERKLLVVDDAQERSDLGLLFQYVANPANNAVLFLSYRPYGGTYIQRQAGRFAMVGSQAVTVALGRLSKKEVAALARQVLKERNGPDDAAEEIARLTLDCPLATVLGAYVVASDGRHYELAKNESTFRDTLLGKFYDVAAGTIGETGDREPIRKLLRVLALLQPFNAEDPALLESIGKVEGLEPHLVARLIRVLNEGGILVLRGGRFRVSPDLLADYIIEQTCIAHDGGSTGYAERMFDATAGEYLENLVVNLGKLDWRRSNGDASSSVLLDGVWGKLEPTEKYGDPQLKAVLGVAYYQPRRALSFVTAQVRKGSFLRDLPPILKRIAYNLKYLREACEILWYLGKDDARDMNPHPEHAIHVLEELCEVEPEKPRAFNETVVDFGLSLIDEPESWKQRHTPFDFLSGILEVEGHTTSATSRTVTWSRFQVRRTFVAPLRKKVIAAILRLLSGTNLRAAVRAARELGNAIRYSTGGDAREEWAAEFRETLRKVLRIVSKEKIEPVVLLEIVRSVSWHAHFGDGTPAEVASEIIAALPTTLEFRTTFALVDGYGMLGRRMGGDFEADRRQTTERQGALAEELIGELTSVDKLRRFLDDILAKILEVGAESSPHEFLYVLLQESVDLAEAIATDALLEKPGASVRYVHLALGVLLVHRRERALELADQMQSSVDPTLQAAVGFAYGIGNFPNGPDERDCNNVRALLQSSSETVVRSGIAALRSLRQHPRVLVDLLKDANLGVSAWVADDALSLFPGEKGELFGELSENDVVALLKRLTVLDELNGHWIEEFLARVSKTHPIACADFFIERVERAAATGNWKLRPCNHRPWGHVPLKFREAPEFGRLLVKVSRWMASKKNAPYLFNTRSAELFNAMFAPDSRAGRSPDSEAKFDAELVGFLRDWIETADEAGLEVIGQLLREGPRDLVFEERSLVLRYLERCKQFGTGRYKSACSQLYAVTVSGSRSGTPGEPFPEDLRLKEQATEALKSIARFAPGRDLYEDFLRYAEHSIRRSLKEGEAFEDE